MAKKKDFVLDFKQMNFISSTGGVEMNNDELKFAEAVIGNLSTDSGVYRYMFFRSVMQFLSYFLSLLSFFLIIPVTISQGKEYGLLFLSLTFFLAFCPLCFGFQAGSANHTVSNVLIRSKMINRIFETEMVGSHRIRREIAEKG